jgi:hypothetical protein
MEIGDFDPPYELAGSAFVAVGTWSAWGEDVAHMAPPGFSPLRIFGRHVGILVGSDFEKPPEELPIQYREVVAAIVVRRGAELMALPFDMVLDQPTPVELGRLHYGMPKRLDASMLVEAGHDRWSAWGEDLRIEAVAHGALARLSLLPIRAAFALGVRLLTRHIEVLGAADGPSRHARIALTPRGLGASLRGISAVVRGNELRPLWCQSWRWSSTLLGAPRELV